MEQHVYPVSDDWAKKAWVDNDKYLEMYKASVADPEAFWAEHGKRLDWIKPYTKVKNTNYGYPDVSIKWFEDGTLNLSANCIDRHLDKRGDQVAIIWEGDDPKDDAKITYRQLHEHVCKLANVFKSNGVTKGDRVTIYM
ncbi:MAG: AMP-binding protein, partial [Rhodobiaceae bacterium]|nr:AMP-binding protein [Rhodobiaceae bacterium]